MDSFLNAVRPILDAHPLLASLAFAGALIGATFAIIAALEAATGGDLRRYRSAAFRTDLTYCVVYQGGIYHALMAAPVLAAVALVMPDAWRLDLLSSLPPLAGFLVFWVLSDAIGYWIHRLQHRSPLLWRLHSIHHTQTTLTFATSYRNHVLEQLYVNLVMYVPLMLLGSPSWYWLPAMLLQNVLEGLQHSDLRWRYGRLYPVFVSPVFHSIHHAPERARHDSNYGKILSVWDALFGTLSRGDRPERYGVAGLETPVSFWSTCVAPFRRGWGRPAGAGMQAPAEAGPAVAAADP